MAATGGLRKVPLMAPTTLALGTARYQCPTAGPLMKKQLPKAATPFSPRRAALTAKRDHPVSVSSGEDEGASSPTQASVQKLEINWYKKG